LSSPSTEELKSFLNPELAPVITHFPLRAVEKARPVLPPDEVLRNKWTLSFKAGLRTSFVFLTIALLCFFVLLVNHSRLKVSNPVHNLQLKDLKKEVGENIALIEKSEDENYINDMKELNEQLIQEIRELDLSLRQYYFGLKAKEKTGAWILFVALVGFFWSMRATQFFKPETPIPVPDLKKGEEQLRERLLGRNALSFFCLVIIGILLVSHLIETKKPGQTYYEVVGGQGEKVVANKLYSQEDFEANTPWLNGARSNRIFEASLPTEFNLAEGKNLKWKIQVPMGGASSPIIWGNDLFLAAANKTKRALYCYDATSGKQKWSAVAKSDKEKGAPTVFEPYVYAACTPATDGNRVYAMFANGDLMATDMKGKVLWMVDFGLPDNDFGHSSSLAIHNGLVVVQWDNASKNTGLYVLDGESGKEKLKIAREDLGASWRSPFIYRDGDITHLIASAERLTSHNIETGELLWELPGIEGEIGSSPMQHEGIVYTLVDDMFGALKIEAGKVSEVWKTDDLAIPDIPNPMVKGDYVYTCDSGGVFSCLNIKTGALIYEHEFNKEVYASPLIVGDLIYVCCLEGHIYVIKTGPAFELVVENDLGVAIHAGPIVYKNSLIIRSDKELFSFAL